MDAGRGVDRAVYERPVLEGAPGLVALAARHGARPGGIDDPAVLHVPEAARTPASHWPNGGARWRGSARERATPGPQARWWMTAAAGNRFVSRPVRRESRA